MMKKSILAWVLMAIAATLVIGGKDIPTQTRWNDTATLDALISKNRTEVYRIYGALETLRALSPELTALDRTAEMEELFRRMSDWLEHPITSEADLEYVLNFFNATQELPVADKVYAVFITAKIIMVVAVIISIIGLGALTTIYIVPLVQKLPDIAKIMGLYGLASGITLCAYFFLPEFIKHFGGLFGALCLGGAYAYNLSFCPRRDTVPATIFLPPILVWSFLAILFHTQLIGFIAVLAFTASLGFSIRSDNLFGGIGWKDESEIPRAIVPSGLLLGVYIARTLGAFNWMAKYMEPFDAGVFFVGTIVYLTALLIVSSKFGHNDNWLCYNLLMAASCIVIIFVGFMIPNFIVFRGIGITFFIFFVFEKFIEIPWGYNWPCALLSGGLLLLTPFD